MYPITYVQHARTIHKGCLEMILPVQTLGATVESIVRSSEAIVWHVKLVQRIQNCVKHLKRGGIPTVHVTKTIMLLHLKHVLNVLQIQKMKLVIMLEMVQRTVTAKKGIM